MLVYFTVLTLICPGKYFILVLSICCYVDLLYSRFGKLICIENIHYAFRMLFHVYSHNLIVGSFHHFSTFSSVSFLFFISYWLTWNSRSFFSDRTLSQRTKDKKIKKIGNLGVRKSLKSSRLHASKFTRKYSILCTVYRGKMGQSQQRTIMLWDEVSRKVVK